MKITIEFDTENELMEPQLASALGELLLNHSKDVAEITDGPDLTVERPHDIDPGIRAEQPKGPLGQVTDLGTTGEEPEVPTYTLEDLRSKVTAVAEAIGGTTPLLDQVEELTGSRSISETDDRHYTTIGIWMDEVLAGGGDDE